MSNLEATEVLTHVRSLLKKRVELIHAIGIIDREVESVLTAEPVAESTTETATPAPESPATEESKA